MRPALLRSGQGAAGAGLLGVLVALSAATLAAVPQQSVSDWNDPSAWLQYPKAAMPAWANALQAERAAEHVVAGGAVASSAGGALHSTLVSHRVSFGYDSYPSGFMHVLEAGYGAPPLMVLSVERPDGAVLELMRSQLTPGAHAERSFSTDPAVRRSLQMQSEKLGFDPSGMAPAEAVFSDGRGVLKGDYTFTAQLYSDGPLEVESSSLLLGGRAFGLMGTDELRRDLAVGLLWGTPLALFVGVTVSVGSVAAGLAYGLYAGYRGGLTDEALMRANDVVYALPALPFLIILAAAVSNSIFVMVGFLMLFGWVGIAKVSRSMAMQLRTRGYVEAARAMGQRDRTVMLRHMLPQLLPYAFASIAISVPAAVTTEAGLSFLGLGDPSYPTWGQMLHDASSYGAAARGLWWWVVPPGLMIAVTGLAFVLIGNALDPVANPRLKK